MSTYTDGMMRCPPHDCYLDDPGPCPRCGASRLQRVGEALDEAREQVEHWESEVDRYEVELAGERRKLALASGLVTLG
jgi:hypothetical protein